MDCLIGHTGFVGSNLLAAHAFGATFNSKNFRDMAGRRFDTVVCAGVSAVKWQANREPEQDWRAISELVDVLATVDAERFVLVSTVDVYPQPVAVNESSLVDFAGGQPYGRHRWQLEQFVAERWPKHLILRLPGMFGPGLKKNALFDLLNDRLIEQIDPQARFQFYDVRRTWTDIQHALLHGIRLLNVATEPVAMGDLAEQFFGRPLSERPGAHALYDFRSIHAGLWHGGDGYLYDREAVLADLSHWLDTERRQAARGPK